MRMLALILISALSLASSSAFAAVFTGNHSFVIVADAFGTEDVGFTAPPGFFEDFPIGTPVQLTSQYDDGASVVLNQCYNPSDPADCYPVFGGGSFSLSILTDVVDSTSLNQGGPFAALDGQWSYDPTVGSFPITGDAQGVSFYGSGVFVGLDSNPRWSVGVVSLSFLLPANTLDAPVSLVGLDVYSRGTPLLQIFVQDNQTGTYGNVFAVVPEPSTALLMGLGLAGLAARRR
jgi:hypothetical protein